MNLLQLLPGLFDELDRMAKTVLEFLNPICHEANNHGWRVRQDSNLQQPDLESGALANWSY